MKPVPVTIFALVAMVTTAAAFTPPRPHQVLTKTCTQTGSRIFGLGAVPDGWKGGFADSNPAYAYPTPDLSGLPILDNMANIPKLTRQQRVLWPQFSWLSVEGDEESRIYQMFAPDISRLGYDDKGRVFSIICPQQGFGSAMLGEMNVEVTVTGNRGWVKEPEKDVYAQLGVEGHVWFSAPTNKRSYLLNFLEKVLLQHTEFPFSKNHSITVQTNMPGDPSNPIFDLKNGTSPSFPIPEYAIHDGPKDKAYNVAYIAVEIGEIKTQNSKMIDDFNQMVIDIFNFGSGNIFRKKSTLTWNVWFEEPKLVNQTEWKLHAEYWRESLDVHHTSPDGDDGSNQTYFDGRLFNPLTKAAIQEKEAELIMSFLKKHGHPSHLDEFHKYLNEHGIKTPILDRI
jgi:hypothetical protein